MTEGQNRRDEISLAASVVYGEMLDDLILTTAISAHREIKRGRVVCGTCGTRCRSRQPLLPNSIPTHSSSTLQIPLAEGSGSSSRAQTPQLSDANGSRNGGYVVGPEKGTGGASGIGSGSGRIDGSGNAFFDCLVCSRPIASNRYAPHLSRCLGLNGSTRRVAARSAAVKARLGNGHDRSSPSPHLGGSDNGDWASDADSVSSTKKKKLAAGTKRNNSPTKPPSKGKKAKSTSNSATPAPQFPRQVLPPSKLGRPPTNMVHLSSPVSSPEKSVISVASSHGGTTGSKTLPGVIGSQTLPGKLSVSYAVTGGGADLIAAKEVILGDESSDADDDY